jgi:hypothetical protein
MSLPATSLFRTCNRSKNGCDACPESFPTDQPLGKRPFFADHKLEKALEVSPTNRATISALAYLTLERPEGQPPPSRSTERTYYTNTVLSSVNLADRHYSAIVKTWAHRAAPLCEEAPVRALLAAL